jgi:heme A synthase
MGRAVYLSAHLTNTLLLVGALVSAAWLASREPVRLEAGPFRRQLLAGFGMALLAGISGAVAALGDTLFPATSLVEGIRADFAEGSHALLRLRLFHPVLAALAGGYLIWLATVHIRKQGSMSSKMLLAVVVVQLLAGIVNVLLLAPVWMQLLHLALGNLLWIALVVLFLEDSAQRETPVKT